MAHDVFISYSSADKAVANAVCAELENHGIRCWVAPRDIRPGEEWGESIVDAINNCRVMVLVFSSSANESPQIRREVERAVNKGVIIVPLRIEEVLPTRSLEYFIGAVHWLDAITPPIEQHVKALAVDIQRIVGDGRGDERPRTQPHQQTDNPEPPRTIVPDPGAKNAPKFGIDRIEAPTSAPVTPQPAKTYGKAIASLICGLLFFFFPAAIVAIVLGHLSRGEISRSGGTLKGSKMALAGLILGYAGVVAIPALILAAIAIPNLINTAVATDESAARGALRTVSTAATMYRAMYGKYPPNLKSLGPQAPGSAATATAAGLIDADLAEGVKSGYRFTYQLTSDSSNFKVDADPLVPGKTGLRYMWIDKSGEVQFSYTPPGP
jgi:type II secretory pathway pseudopilin PulG